MYENCRDNKYFLIYLDTEVRNNDSITKIWLCKVMSEKRGWHVTKSPRLNPPLNIIKKWLKVLDIFKQNSYLNWKLTPKIFKAFLYRHCPAVILIIKQAKLNDSPVFKDFYLFESQLNFYAVAMILVQGQNGTEAALQKCS